MARVDRLRGQARRRRSATDEPSYADRHLADLRRRLIVATVLTIPLLDRAGPDDDRARPARALHRTRGSSSRWRRRSSSTPAGRSTAGAFERPPPPRGRHEHARSPSARRAAYGYSAGRDRVPRLLPGGRPRHGRRAAAALLRHGGGDHHADPARPLPRGPRPEPHVGRDPQAHRPRPAHGPRDPRRRRARHPDRAGRPRGPRPRATRREDPGRRGASATVRSAIDESMVTGESMPVGKEPGDEVIGGTLNGSGSFTLRGHAGRARTRCSPRSSASSRRPRGRGRPSSAWPTS